MKHFKNIAAVGIIAAFAPLSANALGISVTQFPSGQLTQSQTNYGNILAANFASVFATEDFEGFSDLGQIGVDGTTSLSTAVGSFTTLGNQGSGTTAVDVNNVKGLDSERGLNLSIRQDGDDPDNGGRKNTSNTTTGDDTYLDSNDTLGMKWTASAGTNLFDRVLFTLTDPGDQGKTLTITADGITETHEIVSGQDNGEIFNILIAFSSGVTTADISLAKSGVNDGFSLDNARIGAVPLPAAAWLLLFASGGLIAAKRRSARRAA